MNSSKLADYSEIISSIAIVITLAFLTIQMKQNTEAIEATTRQGALESDTQFLTSAINNPEIILAWSKLDPTDEELVQLHEALILFNRNRENDFAQYKRGVLDEATWQRYLSSFSSLLVWERNRNWWKNFGALAFDPDYVAEVNEILKSIPENQKELQVRDEFKSIFGIEN